MSALLLIRLSTLLVTNDVATRSRCEQMKLRLWPQRLHEIRSAAFLHRSVFQAVGCAPPVQCHTRIAASTSAVIHVVSQTISATGRQPTSMGPSNVVFIPSAAIGDRKSDHSAAAQAGRRSRRFTLRKKWLRSSPYAGTGNVRYWRKTDIGAIEFVRAFNR
jgi:hypothetical protein